MENHHQRDHRRKNLHCVIMIPIRVVSVGCVEVLWLLWRSRGSLAEEGGVRSLYQGVRVREVRHGDRQGGGGGGGGEMLGEVWVRKGGGRGR